MNSWETTVASTSSSPAVPGEEPSCRACWWGRWEWLPELERLSPDWGGAMEEWERLAEQEASAWEALRAARAALDALVSAANRYMFCTSTCNVAVERLGQHPQRNQLLDSLGNGFLLPAPGSFSVKSPDKETRRLLEGCRFWTLMTRVAICHV